MLLVVNNRLELELDSDKIVFVKPLKRVLANVVHLIFESETPPTSVYNLPAKNRAFLLNETGFCSYFIILLVMAVTSDAVLTGKRVR